MPPAAARTGRTARGTTHDISWKRFGNIESLDIYMGLGAVTFNVSQPVNIASKALAQSIKHTLNGNGGGQQ